MAQRVIFKRDGSLGTLLSRLREILTVFFTPHMSEHLTEPIQGNDDFKEAARNVKKS